MLTPSAVIAEGGIPTDSTATVIGAMIVVPLSTPIMGIALGAVRRRASPGPLDLVSALATGFAGMAVLLPLGAGTVVTVLLNTWSLRARWLTRSPGAMVTSVDAQSRPPYINVRSPIEPRSVFPRPSVA
ncbi:hypothetical protein GCM10010415_01830 [Streptomyces atrovirens]|uniref:Uncharacterized protein n=1 Tax=Streptomyces atrovirens TaxID=285556 RepID=A0ABW0DXB0_9ACTN